MIGLTARRWGFDGLIHIGSRTSVAKVEDDLFHVWPNMQVCPSLDCIWQAWVKKFPMLQRMPRRAANWENPKLFAKGRTLWILTIRTLGLTSAVRYPTLVPAIPLAKRRLAHYPTCLRPVTRSTSQRCSIPNVARLYAGTDRLEDLRLRLLLTTGPEGAVDRVGSSQTLWHYNYRDRLFP